MVMPPSDSERCRAGDTTPDLETSPESTARPAQRAGCGLASSPSRRRESTLNRVDLLTLSPLLRHGLGAPDNALDFRAILDSGTSMVVNLAIQSPDTRRLLGCLLTVGMESAAMSRADLPASQRVPHHLILDEFSQSLAQSEEALTRMLSETRKYQLFCVMANQSWSQTSDRLRGALQNIGLEIILKAGRDDAEYSARLLGAVDPLAVKHTVVDGTAEPRTHPTFYPLIEPGCTTQHLILSGSAF